MKNFIFVAFLVLTFYPTKINAHGIDQHRYQDNVFEQEVTYSSNVLGANNNYDLNSDGDFTISDILLAIKALFSGSGSSLTPTPAAPTPTVTPSINVGEGFVKDIYKEDISPVTYNQIYVSEVVLNKKALELAIAKNWNGEGETLVLRPEEFGTDLLLKVRSDIESDRQGFAIPSNLEGYYTTNQAHAEILAMALLAKDNYLDFLQRKGVKSEIINIFTTTVLPGEDSIVVGNFSGGSSVIPIDYRSDTLKMSLSTAGIYNSAQIVKRSGVIDHMYGGSGDSYEKLARTMGVYVSTYHELTHALQASYYVDNDHKKKLAYLDNGFFRVWGRPWDTPTEQNIFWENESIGEERQADGLGQYALYETFNFSPAQKQQYHNFANARFADMYKELDEFLDLAEENYPDFNPINFGGVAASAISGSGGYGDYYNELKRLRLSRAFPSYMGYFNPYTEQEVQELILALQ
jgi:hypothetical protein